MIPFWSECITMHWQWEKNKNCPFPLGFCHTARGPSQSQRQHAQNKKAPQGGWQSSPPACTVCCSLPAITITSCSISQCRDFRNFIPRSLNSRDSFPIRKFENLALTSCRPDPILSPPTISFELHAKTAEEIDLEKCNFRNFGSSVTLTLTVYIGSRSHLCAHLVLIFREFSRQIIPWYKSNYIHRVRTEYAIWCVRARMCRPVKFPMQWKPHVKE